MRYWAVVPAAGIGKRMGSQHRPKQYLTLGDKPILQHTLERLAAACVAGIVVCLAEDDPYWDHIPLHLPIPVMRVTGGQERCYSVLNGLEFLQDHADPQDWVLVHDAVRPCVRLADIEKLMYTLATHPIGGLLALRVRDTMKRGDRDSIITETVSRESLWHALTPQMFRLGILSQALRHILMTGENVTDDAQAMEKLGHRPVLVEGHADNIKITHPQDLDLASLFLQQQANYADQNRIRTRQSSI